MSSLAVGQATQKTKDKRRREERTNLVLREHGTFTVEKGNARRWRGVRCLVDRGRTANCNIRSETTSNLRFWYQFDIGDQPRRDGGGEGEREGVDQAGVAEVTWRFAAPSVEPWRSKLVLVILSCRNPGGLFRTTLDHGFHG